MTGVDFPEGGRTESVPGRGAPAQAAIIRTRVSEAADRMTPGAEVVLARWSLMLYLPSVIDIVRDGRASAKTA